MVGVTAVCDTNHNYSVFLKILACLLAKNFRSEATSFLTNTACWVWYSEYLFVAQRIGLLQKE